MAQRRGWGGSATLWGLWGFVCGALAVALALVDRLVFAPGRYADRLAFPALAGGFWARVALVVAGLLLFFLAGHIAARSTRRVEAAIVAGLLAGLVVGLADLILTRLALASVERRGATRSVGRIAQMLAAGALGRSIAGRDRPPASQAYPSAPPMPPPSAAMPAPRFTPAPGYAPDPAQTSAAGHPVPPSPERYFSHPDAPTITPPGA